MWEYALQEELMKKKNRTALRYDYEYHNKKVEEWTKEHPEERREQVRKSAETYRKKNADNEEYLTMRRTSQAAYQRRKYAEAKAEAETDPEKLKELREKRAEKMRKYRAKKKAEAEAAKKQGN